MPVEPADRVLYVDPEGRQHVARIADGEVTFADVPTRLVIARGARVELVEAMYSSTREPGTWSRIVETAS